MNIKIINKRKNIKRRLYLRDLSYIKSSEAYYHKLVKWTNDKILLEYLELKQYDIITVNNKEITISTFYNRFLERIRTYGEDITTFHTIIDSEASPIFNKIRFRNSMRRRVSELNSHRRSLERYLGIEFK